MNKFSFARASRLTTALTGEVTINFNVRLA